MKKIKLLLNFLIISIFFSCNNSLEKSIIEDLSVKELKGIIKKDSLFELTYEFTEKLKKQKLKTNLDRAKWSDISYNRVHKLIKFRYDTIKQNKLLPNLYSKWVNKYSDNLKEFDSIINYWKKLKDQKSLDNYLKIELFELKTNSLDEVEISFKLIPNKKHIDNLSFNYVFIKKENTEEAKNWNIRPTMNKKTMEFHTFKTINKPEIRWSKAPKNDFILKNKTLNQLLEKYIFFTKVRWVAVNGTTLYGNGLDIPHKIKSVLEDSNMSKYYKEDLIKEKINENYISFRNYKLRKIDSISREIDTELTKLIEVIPIE